MDFMKEELLFTTYGDSYRKHDDEAIDDGSDAAAAVGFSLEINEA
jgi:hypothetical protein